MLTGWKQKEKLINHLNFNQMKKMYRITMTEKANFICKEVVLAAAISNGVTNPNNRVSLEGLKGIYLNKGFDNPANFKDTSAELIGNNILHIDQKVDGDYETVCIIEEVEIMELATKENVVLQRQDFDKNDLLLN